MSDSISKSWFSVFNNPEEHGLTGTPEEICDTNNTTDFGS